MKRINWIGVGSLVGLILSGAVIMETFYEIIIKPFFAGRMITLTYFGLGITIVAFIICGSCFTYFEERLNN